MSSWTLTSTVYKAICIFLDLFSESHNYYFLEDFFFPVEVLYRMIFQELTHSSVQLATHHVRSKDENTFVFSTGPLRVIQKIWIVLCCFPSFTS